VALLFGMVTLASVNVHADKKDDLRAILEDVDFRIAFDNCRRLSAEKSFKTKDAQDRCEYLMKVIADLRNKSDDDLKEAVSNVFAAIMYPDRSL
jgi:hypothetical protein